MDREGKAIESQNGTADAQYRDKLHCATPHGTLLSHEESPLYGWSYHHGSHDYLSTYYFMIYINNIFFSYFQSFFGHSIQTFISTDFLMACF